MILVVPELSSWNLTNDHNIENGTQEPSLQALGLCLKLVQGTGTHKYYYLARR